MLNKPNTLAVATRASVMRILLLLLVLSVAIALYLTWDMKASLSFTLKYRGKKLITLILVGVAVSVSTLLFQTLSQNKILTPGIMGFDSLYILIQSMLILLFGAVGFSAFNPYIKWIAETAIMIASTILLYRLFFRESQQSLQFLMLAGIVLGILFSSASGLVFRLLDPIEFTVLQDSLFATFGMVDPTLLTVSLVVISAVVVYVWRKNATLDVMLLGAHCATNLGVNLNKMTKELLIIVAILISISTALVGPITFFGLLVAHLAYRLSPSYQHKFLLPIAALIGMIVLIVGDFSLQHIFSFSTQLSIIIELFGGLFFLALIMYRVKS